MNLENPARRHLDPARANLVREQLERLLADPVFSGAARRSRLLRYLVEETLANRGDSLKESIVGAQVFDRPADYDPKLDSLVRVEVGRLRSRLTEYYLQAQPKSSVRIEIPKGGYQPVFIFEPDAAPVPESAAVAAPPSPKRKRKILAAALSVVLLAATAVGAWRFFAPRRQPLRPQTIAVLPFLNLSGNDADQYLADGIAEELTESLAEFNDFRVVARTSAFQYKGKNADIRDIGRNLQAGAVLEGSVTRRANGVRVIAQLIRSNDGYHLWSRAYDTSLADLASVETEIVEATRLELAPAAPRRKPVEIRDPEAHDLYIRAVYELNQITPASTRKALDLAGQAAARDQSAAQPYVLMAAAESQLTNLFLQPPSVSAGHAWIDINKALALDPANSGAHAQKALLAYANLWDWPQAEREFRLAVATGSHGSAENLYGWCLMTRGRFAESKHWLQDAAALDPLSLGPQLNQVTELMVEGNYSEAQRRLDRIRSGAPPRFVPDTMDLSLAYWRKDCQAATADARTIEERYPQPAVSLPSILADATCGHLGSDLAALAVAAKVHPEHYPSPFFVADIFAIGHDFEHAMIFLERSVELREPVLLQLKIDPSFEPVRQDPRLIAIERKIGLLD